MLIRSPVYALVSFLDRNRIIPGSIAVSSRCVRQHGVLRQMVKKAPGNLPNLSVSRNIDALLVLDQMLRLIEHL